VLTRPAFLRVECVFVKDRRLGAMRGYAKKRACSAEGRNSVTIVCPPLSSRVQTGKICHRVWLVLFLCLCARVSYAFSSKTGLVLYVFAAEGSWIGLVFKRGLSETQDLGHLTLA
jgi:hypothetical protein